MAIKYVVVFFEVNLRPNIFISFSHFNQFLMNHYININLKKLYMKSKRLINDFIHK